MAIPKGQQTFMPTRGKAGVGITKVNARVNAEKKKAKVDADQWIETVKKRRRAIP